MYGWVVRPALVIAAVVAASGSPAVSALPGQAATAQPAAGSAATIADFVALDAAGKPFTDLRPSDILVTVDGRPRVVRALHHVSKGPGAEAAAAAIAARNAASPTIVHADTSRTILFAVDEASIPRGAEKPVVSLVAGLLDMLGPTDRLALARLPGSAPRVEFATTHDPVRRQASRVEGRAAPVDSLARLRDQAPASFVDDEGPNQQQRLRDAARDAGATAASAGAGSSPVPSVDALGRIFATWRGDPGPHTVVLVSTGFAMAGSREAEVRSAIARCLEAAAAARATVYAVRPEQLNGPGDLPQLAQFAQATGGAAVTVGRNVTVDLQRLVRGWTASYIVELEPDDVDRAGRPVSIDIAVRRPGVRIAAARTLSLRHDPLPPVVAPIVAPPPAVSPADAARASRQVDPGAGAEPRRPAPVRRDPVTDAELAVVMARATEYVAGYMRDLPNVVAEEDYEQESKRPQFNNYANLDNAKRRTRSDFLMVTAPGVSGWMPFRDVFEVDGKKLRDREDRLQKLFLDTTDKANAMRDARLLSDESARYNLGTVGRTINVPTLPLAFLTRERVGGLSFRRGPEETVDGIRALRVDFDEWATPTLIRTAVRTDLPASGAFWVDPLTGRVLKTLLRTAPEGVRTEAIVFYRRSDTIGFWMPAEMREVYRNGNEQITCKAVYANYRRFQVSTEEVIRN